MSNGSLKEQILDSLINEAAEEIMFIEDIESNDDAVDEVLDELVENLFLVMECRRGFFNTVPKSVIWRDDILTTLDENRFRQMLRVERKQFLMLCDLIRNDPEFTKAHSSKQFTVELQLAIVLFHLGSSGESASIKKIATIFGVGDGGTILTITKRIFKAFLRLQSEYIYWPDESERNQIVLDTFDELPFCIGYIDGTEIKLAESPVEDHTSYFSRNHVYSIKAQVVCDYKRKIRHIVVGHPGSWHDARIYRNSSLFKQKEQYFTSQQWIAGDSAYPLSGLLITPYRSNSRQLDKNAQIAFNLRHSKYRVRVEHCFGILKERFGSLKQLRMRLANKNSHKLCCDWFLVCCILHNILIDDCPRFNETDLILENTDEDSSEEDFSNNSGEMKRKAIYSLMFS
ncbi:Protein ANTAGONIST OF LIKE HETEROCHROMATIN PROTEIN 1 [Lucilia cuprina]|nr:Protein ANTAGONIST OF LIKE HETEROCHROMATIN PROTEIN 1 [Lucilia cuprina]KAI8118196.1 Protein ANTAGONIST OF LIKE HETEROCHROMATIN PROTEIN 1 [Lucilia cuprina]